MKFDKIINSVLNEAPHIIFNNNMGKDELFDLRFEDEAKKREMSSDMKRRLLHDKVSGMLSTLDDSGKDKFWYELENYMNIDLFLQKVYGMDFASLRSMF